MPIKAGLCRLRPNIGIRQNKGASAHIFTKGPGLNYFQIVPINVPVQRIDGGYIVWNTDFTYSLIPRFPLGTAWERG